MIPGPESGESVVATILDRQRNCAISHRDTDGSGRCRFRNAGTPHMEHTQTSSKHILRQQIEEGLTQLQRSADGLFLSGLSAGLDLGFGPLVAAAALTLLGGSGSALVEQLLVANAYTIGFVFVILGRTELFTEYTTLAVLPVLDRRAAVTRLGRLWGIVYLANLIGGLVFAAVAVVVGPAFGITEPAAFGAIATPLIAPASVTLFGGALLAGWLMGLVSWLVAAAQETISRVFFVWLITFVIGFTHLPHSIAGNIEVLLGLFGTTTVGLAEYGRFLAVATAGNAIGGTTFVALLKYSHVVRGGDRFGAESESENNG